MKAFSKRVVLTGIGLWLAGVPAAMGARGTAPALLSPLLIPIASLTHPQLTMNTLAPRLPLDHTAAWLDMNHFAATQIPDQGFWLRRGNQVAALPQGLQKGVKVAFADLNDGGKVNVLVLTKRLADALKKNLQTGNLDQAHRILAQQFDGSRGGSPNPPLPADATAEELDYIRNEFSDIVARRVATRLREQGFKPAGLKPKKFVALMRKAAKWEATQAYAPSPMARKAAVVYQEQMNRIMAVAATVTDTLEQHDRLTNFIWGTRLKDLINSSGSPSAIVSGMRDAADWAEQAAKNGRALKSIAEIVSSLDRSRKWRGQDSGLTLGELERLTKALDYFVQLRASEFPDNFIDSLRELSSEVPKILIRNTRERERRRISPALTAARQLQDRLAFIY